MSKKKDFLPSVSDTPSERPYILFSHSIQNLEGQILTVIDASTPDPVQRKALKDLISPMIWTWAISNNHVENYEQLVYKKEGVTIGGSIHI